MIQIQNLVKRFGSKYAVDDISFGIDEGEIVGFLGPNGAGKSTTMNIITGYMSSTSGTVSIGGIDILENPTEAKRFIGYLPEQPPLYLDMTVREYLNFVYELKGCKLNRKKHLAEICEVVKITDDYNKNRLIKNLSKGYKQRVGIAQALVGNPRVIILDEPTVGLDPKEIIEIRNLIRTLGETHTVILSTHILPEVQAVCDRILIINAGKIVADEKTENISKMIEGNRRLNARICGSQREVLRVLRGINEITTAEVFGEREGDSFVYSIESTAGVDIRKPLFYALARNNMPLIGLEQQGTNLEDIFISLVDKQKDARKKSRRDSVSFDIKAAGSGANDVKSADGVSASDASDAEAGIDSAYTVIADPDSESGADKPENKEENN
ncbi:MAG TPA: ABC transporter ATP-binding protein [Firmicutes bacterium]|nr:ABC transporter ATP-binding protein [Bacillota bacterium]